MGEGVGGAVAYLGSGKGKSSSGLAGGTVKNYIRERAGKLRKTYFLNLKVGGRKSSGTEPSWVPERTLCEFFLKWAGRKSDRPKGRGEELSLTD